MMMMSFFDSPPKTLFFDGQEATYHPGSKTLKTTIHKAWKGAGYALKWSADVKKPIGIGLNPQIIDFIINKAKCYLLLHVTEAGNNYWINYTALQAFMNTHNTLYRIRGTTPVHVFPWEIFTRKREPVDND